MRVSIVLSTSTGGVGTHVRSLVVRLPKLGVEPHVVAPLSTGDSFGFGTVEMTDFTPVEISAAARLRDVTAVRRLRAAVNGAHVVHAHGFRAASLVALALGRRRRQRTPLVVTWHNAVLSGGARRALLANMERLVARRADVTLAASSDLVQRARALGATDARLAPVAAPAMRPPQRSRDEVRTELGAGERPVVLAVGRLAPQKDYDTLLAAAAHWGGRQPPPLVAVAGDGPELDRLRAAADNSRADVRFLGRRDDVPDLLAAADVYVITSFWEARALVVQEAMRAAVPVVATAVGGLPELVGDDGILVPAGDAEAVSDAVAVLLDDPVRRADLAERGRRRASGWPDEDATAAEVAAVYAELARGARH